MDKTFTHEDLLLFAYGELDDSIQEQAIRQLILNDNILYEEYLQIMDARQMIEKSFATPSEEVMNRIISYSRALAAVDVAEPELRFMIQN
jgi:hypothetical protein